MPRQNFLGLSIYTFIKVKDRRAKQVFSMTGYQWEGVGIGKGE
jgi:hypothetical protein